MTRVVLTDIEGTIADIDFVRQVLFPYARQALPEFIRTHHDAPEVAVQLDAVAAEAGLTADDHEALIAQLQAWIDADRKITPLKALQGMVWKAGYEQGDFTAHLYPDAHAALKAWHGAGVPLYVYSSGSIQAQRLYFAHTDFGDISVWFRGFFDTTSGGKKDAESYRRIAGEIDVEPGGMVFLSDVAEELDAAREAGLKTVQICRPGTNPTVDHPHYPDLSTLELD
jgi:enolase-phosphatase E1